MMIMMPPNGKGLPHLPVGSDKRRVLLMILLTTAEELNEEQQQPPIEEGVTDVEGFPNGPHDTLVLRYFENHVALRVWNGKVCKSLKT